MRGHYQIMISSNVIFSHHGQMMLSFIYKQDECVQMSAHVQFVVPQTACNKHATVLKTASC